MAKNAGALSVYVLTGHGAKHREELLVTPEFVANDIVDATAWILKNINIAKSKKCAFQ